MIRINSITKKWKEFTLSDISFEVKLGEYFVILGPTGCGKTLLLETIAGFHTPDSGSVFLRDKDITQYPPGKRGMGFVYQDYMLFPNLSVAGNIGYGMKVRGRKDDVTDKKVKELSKLMGLENLLNRSPSKLSGGEAQRTAIARALSVEPDIMLFDEPLSALDPNLRAEVRTELRRIHKEAGTTTIHVSHSREDAMVLGDRIAVMNDGKIVQIGTAEEVFQQPGSKFVAEFVGVENIFSGVARRDNGTTVFESENVVLYTTSEKSGIVHASIRPEDIIISPGRIESSARNCIQGEVLEIVDIGQVMRVSVDCGIRFFVNITRASCIDLKLTIGQKVYLVFKAQNVNLFDI